MSEEFDLFIIGAGSGGMAASKKAASLGFKVGICEEDQVGGTCVIRGCVPKKLLVYASEIGEKLPKYKKYGWHIGDYNFDLKKFTQNKIESISSLSNRQAQNIEKTGAKLYRGKAKFINTNTLEINGEKVRAKKFLIATGSKAFMPSINGIENAITSNEALDLEKVPSKIAIVGGGYIAVEFASIFNSLGSEVTLIYRGNCLLKHFDSDIGSFLMSEMEKKSIKIKLETNVTSIEKQDQNLKVHLDDNLYIESEKILFATGRIPNIEGLNLDQVGIELDNDNAIKVDNYSKTNIDNIFAVGDVTNRVNLTPVAINEARAFVDSEFGDNRRHISYKNIPSAIFSQPACASVGLSEEEARKSYKEIEIYKSVFGPLSKLIDGDSEQVMMKMIIDKKTNKILGLHMVGKDSPELMQGFAVAVKMGSTKKDFDNCIAIHPTIAEEFVTMKEPIKS